MVMMGFNKSLTGKRIQISSLFFGKMTECDFYMNECRQMYSNE